jgi:tripartite-type tricarboxylate transporter receptor subunit TctC
MTALRLFARSILSAVFGFGAAGTMAQSYPAKPIRIIIPFGGGGPVDLMGRAFGQKFTDAWGQMTIVEPRLGAGGNIAADVVAKSAPDGYTLLLTTTGHAISPSLYRKLPYNTVGDFAPVTQIISTYLVLVSSAKLPVASVKELIALAKAQPGKLNFAHTGVGAAPYLVAEMLKLQTGIDVLGVPYKTSAPLVLELLAGDVQYTWLPPTDVLEHVHSGRMRALAVSGTSRGSALPDTPTMTEAGLPEVEYVGWVGLFAPAGTPRDILAKISAETARALRMPDIIARLPSWGGEAAATTPEQFSAKFKSDVAKYAKIIKEAGVPPMD